jgi:diaminopimelate epimerase
MGFCSMLCPQNYAKPVVMALHFRKYQGTGNDFVLIDDRLEEFDLHNHALIARLCDRRFGIGADGLMLLRYHEVSDFQMLYFNADGQKGSMCGNGARCIVAFALKLGLLHHHTVFMAPDGLHEARWEGDLIGLKMKDVTHWEVGDDYYFVNTGSPHYVRWVTDLDAVPVVEQGRAVRYGPVYGPQGGTNVNFVEAQANGSLRVRTYERGVEDETYSCGTGAVACALVAHLAGKLAPPTAQQTVKIQTKGGELSVSFLAEANKFAQVWLNGPAQEVYEGTIED